MKKLITYILFSIVISFFGANISFAEEPPADWGDPNQLPSNTLENNDNNTYLINDETLSGLKSGTTTGGATGSQENIYENVDSLKEATFDVTDILKLDDQPQSYFSKGDSPIVAAILMFIEFATRIIGILAVILLIIAGFMFMTAQGNQQGIDNAKDVVKYAVIGLAVTFLSYVIITFIQSMFTQ